MAAGFVLGLDTTAPQLEWGAVAGTSAGDLLRIAYALDEPELLDATLRLPDGRQLTLAVLGGRLEVVLPPDTPSGPGQVTARVRDDVWNEATYELVVALQGATGALPDRGPGGASHPTWSPPLDPTTGHRVIEFASRAAAASSARVIIRRRVPATAVATSSQTVVRRMRPAGLTVGAARSRTRVSKLATRTTATAGDSSTYRIVRRRDGRALEEALLLDLL